MGPEPKLRRPRSLRAHHRYALQVAEGSRGWRWVRDYLVGILLGPQEVVR